MKSTDLQVKIQNFKYLMMDNNIINLFCLYYVQHMGIFSNAMHAFIYLNAKVSQLLLKCYFLLVEPIFFTP